MFFRKPIQNVYFWPSLSEYERLVLRDAFFQIGRRTCVKFVEQEYKPWFHADRWDATKPYVIIRKSEKYAAYSSNTVEDTAERTILYISENAFYMDTFNHSRGAIMDQLVRFLGTFIRLFIHLLVNIVACFFYGCISHIPVYQAAQLMWPFDPESVTVPLWARDKYRLTQYCPARNDADIGAGQRVGLLTKWDTVKLNTMYCPERVHADPQRGPCVVPRQKDIEEFKYRVWAYKRLLNRN
ncbi:unnamed protein product [Angiostrongylus costaricensis]|uniref:PKD_channel domain-containing protein n=1 Tax=Angiostrongylus costaricensis TaxID=334426 RepID=A0A158PG94_ANGCS|nr:unnamed protein product [Angiostrongylus costaricensis]